MELIKGNLLTIESGIICHQVNCKGVMGAGLAKSLREKYPVCFTSYSKYCKEGKFLLGMVQFVKVNPGLYICNMAGQNGYGIGKRQTDYDALTVCLNKLHTKSIELGLTPYLPYKMGCGLAGGGWNVVGNLIRTHCPNAVIVQI
jgi:O-acetyl-ADP-ribose deacetylase (regulator of RNase III)